MDSIVIQGNQLRSGGSVALSGCKHMAVASIAYALGSRSQFLLRNVPNLSDIDTLRDIICLLGGSADFSCNSFSTAPAELRCGDIPATHGSKLRGSLYLLPAIISNAGYVRFQGSGGCPLEPTPQGWVRSFSHVFDILEYFGCVRAGEDILLLPAGGLKGIEIDILSFSDHPARHQGSTALSATKLAILCAQNVDRGTTIIKNPVKEPVVSHLLALLEGEQRIDWVSECEVTICGRSEGKTTAGEAVIAPDSREAFTYVALAVANGISLTLRGMAENEALALMPKELKTLALMGVPLQWSDRQVTVYPAKQLSPVDVACYPDKEFGTDNQPLLSILASRASGPTEISDYVWPKRFNYLLELESIGLVSSIGMNSATIYPSRWSSSSRVLAAQDVRAAAAFLIAALIVPGETRLRGMNQISRGYSGLIENIRNLGASIFEVEPSGEL